MTVVGTDQAGLLFGFTTNVLARRCVNYEKKVTEEAKVMEEKKATEATGETVEENKGQETQDKTMQAAEKKEGTQQAQNAAAEGGNAEKDQKKDQEDADGDEEELSAKSGERKDSKKLLLLLFLVAVVILAFAAGIAAAVLVPRLLEQRRIAAELKALEAPAFYFTEEDAVSSVTVVLGERRYEKFLEDIFEDGTVIRETEGTESTAEETQTLSQSVQEGTEGTETESTETATQEETVQPVVREVYQYYPQEEDGIQKDIREYMEYLQSEKNFLDISDIMDADKEMEGVADLLEEEDSQVQGYWLVGSGANPESYLILSIVQYPEYYQVRTKVGEKSFTQYVAGLWEERDQVQADTGLLNAGQPITGQRPAVTSPDVPTQQYLEEKIASMSQEELKLPEPTENYEFMVNNGAVYVEGTEYFRVTAYRPNEEGTLSYECTYLMDIDGNLHYTYDEVTGEATPFP